MWHWLHKNVRAVNLLLRFSVAASVGLHLLCIMILILMHYLQPTRQLTIQRSAPLTTEVTIVIDPRASVTGVVMPTQTQKSSTQTSQSAAVIKPEPEKPKTTIISKPITAKPSKKQQRKKPAKLPKKKKPAKPTKKEAIKPKPKESDKKVIEQVKPQPTPTEATKLPVGNEVPLKIDGPIMIARSASDAAALAVQLEIQEELLRVWRPPVGIDEGVSCTITVTLDDTGAAQTVEIVKPSGILLFDVSARAAIQQAVWPRAFWGATLELCLQ
jgi:outer membrane biosynthesis protein TonB